MSRARTALTVLALGSGLALTGCQTPVDRCQTIGAPDPRLVEAAGIVVAGEAVEVEVEVTNPSTDATSECVVVGDRWANLTDVDEQ